MFTIIDEDGVHTIDEDENIMCAECNATNSPVHRRCCNCGSKLTRKKVEVITTKV